MDGAIFLCLTVALAFLLWRGRSVADDRFRTGPWLRVRTALTPLLFALCLMQGCDRSRFDTVRVDLTGVTATHDARSNAVGPALVVGGRADRSDIVVAGAGDDAVQAFVDFGTQSRHAAMHRETPLSKNVKLTVEKFTATLHLASEMTPGGASIVAYDVGDGRQYVGAEDIDHGDEICLNRCSAPDARWFVFHEDSFHGARLVPKGVAEPSLDQWPDLDTQNWPASILRPYGPTDRIYRLSEYLCERVNKRCETPVRADPVGREPAAVAKSFLFQTGSITNRGWKLMRLDAGARAVGTTPQPEPAASASAAISMLVLRSSRLQELRSFRVSLHPHVSDRQLRADVALALDTPSRRVLDQDSLSQARFTPAASVMDADSLRFAIIGTRQDSPLSGVLASYRDGVATDCAGLGKKCAKLGMGRIDFTIDRMKMPWMLLLIVFASAIVYHLLGERVWRLDPVQGTAFTLIFFLLTLRALIGIEGVLQDPAIDWRAIYRECAIALVVIPAFLLTPNNRNIIVVTAFFIVLGMTAISQWLGFPNLVESVLTVASLIALAVRWAMLGSNKKPRQSNPVTEKAATATTSNTVKRSPLFWILLLSIVLVVGRLVLLWLGFKERVFGFPITIAYVPIMLALVAIVLAQAERTQPDRQWRPALIFNIVLVIVTGVVAWSISDIGFALVHLPPICALAIWRLTLWRSARKDTGSRRAVTAGRWLWVAPTFALVVSYVAIWPAMLLTAPPTNDPASRLAYAIKAENLDPNVLRLRAMVAPDQIRLIGNHAAAIQMEQTVLLQTLTERLFGRGFAAAVDLRSFKIKEIHLSDVVSASHIMSPYGRAGAFGLLLVIFAAAGAMTTAPSLASPTAWRPLAGALAIWTVFGAAIYMVLSNLQLMPFTGRNIYLLSPSSGGDLLEGTILILMACFWLKPAVKR